MCVSDRDVVLVSIDLTGIDQGLKLKFALKGVKSTVAGAETALHGKLRCRVGSC